MKQDALLEALEWIAKEVRALKDEVAELKDRLSS